jgi:hypothetical protein
MVAFALPPGVQIGITVTSEASTGMTVHRLDDRIIGRRRSLE